MIIGRRDVDSYPHRAWHLLSPDRYDPRRYFVRMRIQVVAIFLFAGAATLAGGETTEDLLVGRFDNKAQISKATEDHSVPHVVVAVESTPCSGWTLWRIRVETDSDGSFEQTWAMYEERRDHHAALVPYYQLKQNSAPAAASFDPGQWLSLEACTLRGGFSTKNMSGFAEGEPCVAVSMNVGARRALLPVAFETNGKVLRVDLNLRGQRTQIVADRVP